MNRTLMILAVAACGSCGQPQNGNAAAANQPPNLEAIEPGGPDGLPDDRTPVEEPNGPIDPKSAEAAGQVMQMFGGLLEQRKFVEAYRLWSDDGRASGLSEAEFVAEYGKYAEIHSEVGRPGAMEGAAGSIYIDVPLRLYGKLNGGRPFDLAGTATLRRANDVPGSTEEQRRWHIYKSDLVPRP